MSTNKQTVSEVEAMLKIKYGIDPPTKVVRLETKRYLTAGEIALSKLIFNNSINYSKVLIKRGGLLGLPNSTKNAMTPFGEIHLPEESFLSIKDFSVSKEASDRIWFIHEMAHVWQHQLGYNNFGAGLEIGIRGGYTSESKAYDYDLLCDDQDKKLNQFNMEQQGEIISHYYDAVYLTNFPNHDLPISHKKNLAQLAALKKVLQDFLNNPSDKNLLPLNYGKFFWHSTKSRY